MYVGTYVLVHTGSQIYIPHLSGCVPFLQDWLCYVSVHIASQVHTPHHSVSVPFLQVWL